MGMMGIHTLVVYDNIACQKHVSMNHYCIGLELKCLMLRTICNTESYVMSFGSISRYGLIINSGHITLVKALDTATKTLVLIRKIRHPSGNQFVKNGHELILDCISDFVLGYISLSQEGDEYWVVFQLSSSNVGDYGILRLYTPFISFARWSSVY